MLRRTLRKSWPLAALALVVLAILLLLPRLAMAVGTGGGSLAITGGTPPPLPAGVGTVIPVSFQVDVTGDNNQTESGPASITNEVFTVSAGSGTVVSAGGPLGYTTTGTGTSTATITGNGQTSFTISAGVEYTAAEAGNNNVTCNGTIYFSDGTTAPGSGTVQVTAVAVDSITAPAPSSMQVGQTLTRSDFTITTTPTGFGNYQFPETQTYLVGFSPTSFAIAIGDNVVTASCGDTNASVDVIGVEEASSWTSSSYDFDTNQVTSGFTTEINGINGSYSVTGPNVISGDTSGQLADDVPFSGTVTMNPDADGTDYATVTTPSSESGTSGISGISSLVASGAMAAGGPAAVSAESAGGIIWDATGVVVGVGGAIVGSAAATISGAVVFGARIEFLSESPQITPKIETELLSLDTANLANYTAPPVLPAQVTSTAAWAATGTSYYGIIGGYYHTTDPEFQVNCSAPTYPNQVTDIAVHPNVTFDFETDSHIDLPTVDLGEFPGGEDTAFCDGNANGLDDTAAGATQVKGSFSGRCGIVSDWGKASLITVPNDAGWVAGPVPLPSAQAISVEWFY